MKKILFICRHNRFRSKIAEAYFKKINKNKNWKAESAGIFRGLPVHKNVMDIGKKFGLRIKRQTRGISERLAKEADLMIVTANNIPASLFKGESKKVILWDIPDTNQGNRKKIEKIAELIIDKVNQLAKRLK